MSPPRVKPELIRWARERAGFEPAQLVRRFPSLARWERGQRRPSLKSIERFAAAVHVPIDYLYLAEPPIERLPIPDRRGPDNDRIGRPSPDLLETIDVCLKRQAWYREAIGAAEVAAQVGSANARSDVAETAATIRKALGLSLETQRKPPTWIDALRKLTERIEGLGILVMASSVVLNNNRRRLRPEEFRGFTLADPLASLVFVNAAETKAAQMFTLAHQLAHVWLGQSAVCDAQVGSVSSEGPAKALPSKALEERWCDRVALELLVPLEAFKAEHRVSAELRDEVVRLVRRFKVSPLVVLRRLHDIEALPAEELRDEVQAEQERLRAVPKGKGGNFYLSLGVRVSKRFARALVASAVEGRASSAEALRLLGLKKADTLKSFGQRLGVVG